MENKSLEILKSLISTFIFILLYKYLPFKVAVIIGVLYGALFYIHKYIKYRRFESFDVVVIAGLIVQLLLSFISKNKMVYFIYPIISNLVYATIFAVSLIRKKDVASYLAKDMCRDKETYVTLLPAFRRITFLWLGFFLLKAFIGALGIFYLSFERIYWILWIIGTPGYFLLSWFGFYYCKKYYVKVKSHDVLGEDLQNNKL